MAEEFISYRKFIDLDSAEEIFTLLTENNIDCRLIDNQHSYLKVVGYNSIDFGVTINIKSDDFSKADKILESFYSKEIESIDQSHYLFEFTEAELKDILSNPYDWGELDLQLAKKLLQGKGIYYDDKYLGDKKEEKVKELAKIKKVAMYKLVLGYLLSLVFPVAGFIIGFLIVINRIILPNGQKFYLHSDKDRNHGKFIAAISIIWTTIIIFLVQ